MPTQGVYDSYCSALIAADATSTTLVPPFFQPIDIYRWGIGVIELLDTDGDPMEISVNKATFDETELVADIMGSYTTTADVPVNSLVWLEPDGTIWTGPYALDSDEVLVVEVDTAATTGGDFFFLLQYRRRPFVSARSTDLTLVTEGTIA